MDRWDFLKHTRDLIPPDTYNVLTNLSKNMLSNQIYLDRSYLIYYFVIEWTGEMGQELYDKSMDFFNAADETGE
jgi:hypothetical protein